MRSKVPPPHYPPPLSWGTPRQEKVLKKILAGAEGKKRISSACECGSLSSVQSAFAPAAIRADPHVDEQKAEAHQELECRARLQTTQFFKKEREAYSNFFTDANFALLSSELFTQHALFFSARRKLPSQRPNLNDLCESSRNVLAH